MMDELCDSSPNLIKIRSKHCRRRLEFRKYIFVVLFLAYIGVTCFSLVLKSDYLENKFVEKLGSKYEFTNGHSINRHRREAENDVSLLGEEEELNCTPRAIEEFPDNFFTVQDTKDGGIAAHIALSLYMFGALAIVCDDYFVSALEVICEELSLQEDVAGATFMAAGSSAPEFFTSVIGVFIAKSDVGVGTIVGSAVFNILFIIGACAIFSGMLIKLTWYPMTRDCLFYLISIAALVIVIDDEKVYWYEAMIFVILYFVYILLMYFNRFLEEKSIEGLNKLLSKCRGSDPLSPHHNVDPRLDEKQPLSEHSQSGQSYSGEKECYSGSDMPVSSETPFNSGSFTSGNPHVNVDDKTIESPFDIPGPIIGKIYWIVMLPLKILMYITIPDCRKSGIWRKLYMVTFILSIVWIAGCSYLMVWMVTIIGDALDIPDTVMGLTILAAGTSVPDCLSSIFVARDGYGDMAVSNSIGSNVFDILICLGLPWLLDTTIVKKGDPLLINSGGIAYSALILLSTVAFMLIAINLAKWRLTKAFGILCMFAYVAVIAISCLFELNVFGDFVLPSCDRT
ncbi:hypothetical protein ACF0H5_018037 [Mactra antiquata]